MELRVSAGPERLRSLENEWRTLLARSGQDQPTLTPEWVLTWLDVFGSSEGRRLHVAEFREADRLAGLAPLVARRRRYRGVLPLRRLELACSGERAEDEILSEYIGVLAERGSEAAVAETLVAAVDARRFGATDEFSIPAMSSEDPMAEALAAAFAAAGWRSRLFQTAEAPYATLGPTWEQYVAGLPSRRRYTIRRAERDLEAWAGGPPCVRVAQSQEELERGQAILARLHGQRWQAAGRQGAFASSGFSEFHRRVMPALLEKNMLELLWLEAKDEPLAVLYNVVWRGRVCNYQSGRRMDLPESLRPGLAVHAIAIRRAIELGRREYDFLGGARRYKREFSSGMRGLVTLEALRGGPRHGARRLLDRLAGVARRVRRRGPGGEATPSEED